MGLAFESHMSSEHGAFQVRCGDQRKLIEADHSSVWHCECYHLADHLGQRCASIACPYVAYLTEGVKLYV